MREIINKVREGLRIWKNIEKNEIKASLFSACSRCYKEADSTCRGQIYILTLRSSLAEEA